MVTDSAVTWRDAFPPLFLRATSYYQVPNIPSPDDFIPINPRTSDQILDALVWIIDTDESKLADLFPSLRHFERLGDFGLPTPLFNLLTNNGYSSVEDLMAITLGEFSQIRGAGQGKLVGLAKHLINLVLAQIEVGEFWSSMVGPLAASSRFESLGTQSTDAEPTGQRRRRMAAEKSLVSSVTEFSLFLHYSGKGEEQVVKAFSPGTGKDFIPEYNAGLARVTADEWLVENPPPTLSGLADGLMNSFTANEVERGVLEQRILPRNPETLDAVGGKFSLTRERVRQIEQKLNARLEELLSLDEHLVHAVRAIRSFCMVPIREEDLFRLLPNLKEKSAAGLSYLEFYAKLGRIDLVDGWAIANLAGVEANLKGAVANSLMENQIIDGDRLAFFAGVDWKTLELDQLSSWMRHSGYQDYKGHWSTIKNLPDLAVLVLAVEGEPLTSTQILEALGSDKSRRSLENAMAGDDRFSKVNRDEWGLKEWGHDEYTTIQDAIDKHLEKNGSTPIDELIALFAPKFKVQPGSIRAYASSGQFATVDGYVKRSAAARTGRKGVASTKNLYKTPNGYALRLEITKDRKRGSGNPCPAALATAYGVTQGSKKTFSSEFGDFTISFASLTTTFSSMKKVCDELALEIGDQVMVTFSETAASFKKVDLSLSGVDLVTSLAGLPPASEWQKTLAASLDMDFGANLEEILEVAKKRKEVDLVAAIGTINPE